MRAQVLTQVRLEPDQPRFLNYSISPLYGRNQEIVGAVLAFHDDTLTKSWSAWSDFGLGVAPDAVFDSLDRGLFIVNPRRMITAFNRTAQKLTGFSPEEVLGRYCWEVLQGDRCKTGCALKASLEDGVTRKDQDVRLRKKAGGWLNLLISTAPIRNHREAIVGGMQTFQSLGLALPRRPARPPISGEVESHRQKPPHAQTAGHAAGCGGLRSHGGH